MGKAKLTQFNRYALATHADPFVRVTQESRFVLAPWSEPGAAVSGTALVYPGMDTSLDKHIPTSVSRRNRLSSEFYVQSGSTLTIHVTTKPSDGNIGVCRIDGGDDHAQASPVDSTDYSWVLLGGGQYFIYSWNSNNYRGGLTGSGTYDFVGVTVTGVEVTQLARYVLAAGPAAARVTQLFRYVLAADTTPDPICPPSSGAQHGHVSVG